MAQQIRPARLKDGARIGIVNPAYWLEDERLQRAIGVFEDAGFVIVPGKSTQLRQDIFAGSPETRAADIMTMFEDPSIDAIICARGGYGGNRVLPLLDYDVIRGNPKIFVGYSDTTGMLSSIAQRSGVVTFHGPMLTTWGRQTIDYNLATLRQVLSGASDVRVDFTPECPARVLRQGKARGELWGGNLTLINERLGTPVQLDLDVPRPARVVSSRKGRHFAAALPDLDDAILFVELEGKHVGFWLSTYTLDEPEVAALQTALDARVEEALGGQPGS